MGGPPTASQTLLFHEDEVALKTNSQVNGIVERTWHDIDGPRMRVEAGSAFFDPTVPEPARLLFLRTGKLPRDHVLVQFGDPSFGLQLRPESHLQLLDRSFPFGDVVKRRPTDQMTGTVIRTSVVCSLRPSCRALPKDQGGPPSTKTSCLALPTDQGVPPPAKTSHDSQDLHDIPGEELSLTGEYHEGDFVIYRGWAGVVEDFEEEVAIRLDDGSVVVLEDSLEVEVPIDAEVPINAEVPIDTAGSDDPPSQNGRTPRGHRNHTANGSVSGGARNAKSVPVDRVSVGQYVVTKKWNLRRGQWKYGSYNANTPPRGFVVEVRPVILWIRWLCSNFLSDRDNVAYARPREDVEASEFETPFFCRYDRGRAPQSASTGPDEARPLGSLQGSDLQAGDYVRFRDLAGACVKYDGRSAGSTDGRPPNTVVKIDRRETQGYDVNTFLVTGTTTKVSVLWQDLSQTDELSSGLVPYLNIDEHDLWPGELITAKIDDDDDDDKKNDEMREARDSHVHVFGRTELDSRPRTKVGVAQAVDAKERIAKVRWFLDPRIEVIREPPPTMLLGSVSGPIGDTVEDKSLYELTAQPGLSRRRGDFVALSSGASDACLPFDVDWFGEIVDLRLDGLISVRLGAAATCREVHLPVEKVMVVYGDDQDDHDGDDGYDDDEGEGEDMDGYDYDDGSSGIWNERTPRPVRETIEYEGGERITADGGDEMWLTDNDTDDDDDDDRVGSTSASDGPISDVTMRDAPSDSEPASREISPSRFTTPPEHPEDGISSSSAALEDRHSLRTSGSIPTLHPSDAPLASPPPDKVTMLDTAPPSDHAFLDLTPTPDVRRLHREYSILRRGLPDNNIWVQTWEARLDLMRVLILGPLDTPYALAPFVMDFHFGPLFPAQPPSAHFHSWTNGYGRVNPNLYEDGKICLSLLGTWPADAKNEGWSKKSTVLQVLVSLMGLVLVKEPYYNEAGFDVLVDTPETAVASSHYTERTYTLGRGFVKHALTRGVVGMEPLVRWLYLPSQKGGLGLLKEVVRHSRGVLARSQNGGGGGVEEEGVQKGSDDRSEEKTRERGSGNVVRVSAGAAQMLRRQLKPLEELLAKDEAAVAGGKGKEGE